jgi:hypothetical protein
MVHCRPDADPDERLPPSMARMLAGGWAAQLVFFVWLYGSGFGALWHPRHAGARCSAWGGLARRRAPHHDASVPVHHPQCWARPPQQIFTVRPGRVLGCSIVHFVIGSHLGPLFLWGHYHTPSNTPRNGRALPNSHATCFGACIHAYLPTVLPSADECWRQQHCCSVGGPLLCSCIPAGNNVMMTFDQ